MRLNNKEHQPGIGSAERQILEGMSRLGKTVIRATDLETEFGYSKLNANLALSRLTQKGWLQRLKMGVYRIVPLGSYSTTPMPDDAWAIAMELFTPCYLSGWTAAEHWGLTEQIFNSTVVFTTQKLRKKELIVAGLNYRTQFILPEEIFGTKKIWSNNTPILIADLHRTIIDVLDNPEIGGGGRHAIDLVKAYMQHQDANPDALLQYAEKLNSGAIFKRLGFLAENMMHMPNSFLDTIHQKIKSGIIKFDPHGPNTGRIVTKWGIRINIPDKDLL